MHLIDKIFKRLKKHPKNSYIDAIDTIDNAAAIMGVAISEINTSDNRKHLDKWLTVLKDTSKSLREYAEAGRIQVNQNG